MSAEEMRVELESFVNEGLEKGWCGWPAKGPSSDVSEPGTTCCPRPTMAMLYDSIERHDLFLGGRRFWPGQAFVARELSGDFGGRSCDTAWTPRRGENGPFLRRCW